MLRFSTQISSLAEFLQLPEFKPALEFFDGRIIQKMSPMLPHSVIQTGLLLSLNAFARPRQLGGAYPELRAVFGGAAQVPDISFYGEGRLPRLVRGDDPPDLTIPPDIAIEILSRGQSVSEVRRKLRHSIKHGTKLGWLFRTKPEDIAVLRRGEEPRILRVGDVLDGEDVLPGFAIPIEEIFGWLHRY